MYVCIQKYLQNLINLKDLENICSTKKCISQYTHQRPSTMSNMTSILTAKRSISQLYNFIVLICCFIFFVYVIMQYLCSHNGKEQTGNDIYRSYHDWKMTYIAEVLSINQCQGRKIVGEILYFVYCHQHEVNCD